MLNPQGLEECGKKGGVKTAVIISAGFKETGEQGKILEDKIKRVAKGYGMRLIGPNCLGFINTDPKVSLNKFYQRYAKVWRYCTCFSEWCDSVLQCSNMQK